MNLQVTILKILVSYPDGFAVMADVKRDMALLATSGAEWAERTRRLAARVANLDIFSQGLVERLNGGWRITDKGRATLDFMEARNAGPELPAENAATDALAHSQSAPLLPLRLPAERGLRRRQRRERRRAARAAARATGS